MNYNVELTEKFNLNGINGKVIAIDGTESILDTYVYGIHHMIDDVDYSYLRFRYDDEYRIIVIDDSFNEKYIYCYACERIEPKAGSEKVYIYRWGELTCVDACKKCLQIPNKYHVCSDCGRKFSSGCIYSVTGTDKNICHECKSKYAKCPKCGRLYMSEDDINVVHGIFNDDNFCEFCVDDFGGNDYIRNYHVMKDKSNYTFMNTPSDVEGDTPYIGFELEIDDGNRDNESCAEEIYNVVGNLLRYESDYSLDYGFEIISQPISESYYNEHLDTIKRILDICIENGYTSHDRGTCGLHMHMNKSYFGNCLDSAVAKLLFIFDRHWDNLRKFSRRKKLNYCNKYDFSYSCSDTSIAGVVKHSKTKDYLDIDRYFAINLTNDNTIEVRLWRGTLRYETFLATLKFTFRLMKLCKYKSALSIYKMSWEEILGDDPDIVSYWNRVKDIRR